MRKIKEAVEKRREGKAWEGFSEITDQSHVRRLSVDQLTSWLILIDHLSYLDERR